MTAKCKCVDFFAMSLCTIWVHTTDEDYGGLPAAFEMTVRTVARKIFTKKGNSLLKFFFLLLLLLTFQVTLRSKYSCGKEANRNRNLFSRHPTTAILKSPGSINVNWVISGYMNIRCDLSLMNRRTGDLSRG